MQRFNPWHSDGLATVMIRRESFAAAEGRTDLRTQEELQSAGGEGDAVSSVRGFWDGVEGEQQPFCLRNVTEEGPRAATPQ